MAALSKPIATNLYNRDRQLVTRYQEQRIRRTFPFLSLPPELRNIIYDLCLSFTGLEDFFDSYYAVIKYHSRPQMLELPKRFRTTPQILLLCRQIHAEAVILLQKKEVTFSHGLLDIKGIPEVISEHALRNLGSVNINMKGHAVLQKNILFMSWTGYLNLITELANMLAKGHKLKKLVLDLTDEQLAMHTHECWYQKNACDFRETLEEALNTLRKVRQVGHVEIFGLDPIFAYELKKHMESKPISLLDLPGELRNKIYGYAANYSDVSLSLRKAIDGWHDQSLNPPYPTRSTPTILLLNKQITNEATETLRSRNLTIDLPDDLVTQKQAEIPNLLQLITPKTLQNVQHLDMRVNNWIWIFSVEVLFQTLRKQHNLKSFHLMFKDNLKSIFMSIPSKKYPDKSLHLSLSSLANVRGIEHVTIDGDLPTLYTSSLAQIMRSPRNVTTLPVLQSVSGDGSISNADEDDV